MNASDMIQDFLQTSVSQFLETPLNKVFDLQKINEVYNTLSDEESRRTYIAELKHILLFLLVKVEKLHRYTGLMAAGDWTNYDQKDSARLRIICEKVTSHCGNCSLWQAKAVRGSHSPEQQ